MVCCRQGQTCPACSAMQPAVAWFRPSCGTDLVSTATCSGSPALLGAAWAQVQANLVAQLLGRAQGRQALAFQQGYGEAFFGFCFCFFLLLLLTGWLAGWVFF